MENAHLIRILKWTSEVTVEIETHFRSKKMRSNTTAKWNDINQTASFDFVSLFIEIVFLRFDSILSLFVGLNYECIRFDSYFVSSRFVSRMCVFLCLVRHHLRMFLSDQSRPSVVCRMNIDAVQMNSLVNGKRQTGCEMVSTTAATSLFSAQFVDNRKNKLTILWPVKLCFGHTSQTLMRRWKRPKNIKYFVCSRAFAWDSSKSKFIRWMF